MEAPEDNVCILGNVATDAPEKHQGISTHSSNLTIYPLC